MTEESNPVGRPPLFETEEALSSAIKEYFTTDAYVEMGEAKMYVPTISGLAMYLGMTTETLRAYGEKEIFSATVKKAKQRVEVHLEQRLYGTAVTGSIFNLKNNFGWKDKSESEISGPGGGPIKTDNNWSVEFVNATKKEEG
jgi:hypothetical protein